MGISIVICTHNGAERLPETLRHLALQQVPSDFSWEVLLIDNNSDDASAAVARQEWEQYRNKVPFQVKRQPVPGLTAAREMGLAIARYNYVLLCDDDNWLAPDYIALAHEIMRQHKNIGMLGGCGKLAYGEEPPSWIMHLNLLAAGPQAPASGKVSRNIIYGAGCIVRKAAYERVLQTGFQFMLSDRQGNVLASGGDHELCYVLALAGYDIWYDERLQFTHYITKDRLTWTYFLKYIKESSYCFYVLEPYKILLNVHPHNVLQFRIHLLRTYLYLLRNVVRVQWKRAWLSPQTDRYKALTLRLIILKARLTFYSKYSVMRTNFMKASDLKKRLRQTSQVMFAENAGL